MVEIIESQSWRSHQVPRWLIAVGFVLIGVLLTILALQLDIVPGESDLSTGPTAGTGSSVLVVNPCPVALDASLASGGSAIPAWSGRLDIGPNAIALPLKEVDKSSEVTILLSGGSLTYQLDHWFSDGIVTIPALSCPSS